ncbi:hypothetical protein BDQ17DRAFT_1357989 [Cyathus striatus]|nr:hypothetical protein BDQ17DRAFT_1357989 [Cyathus striatus]
MFSFNDAMPFISSKRLQARVLSTIICAILIVLRPFSKFGGSSAFLALTIKELVFSAQGNLPQQIEATVLHLSGGLLAIAVSAVANSLASLRDPSSPTARFIPALFLALITFSAGWIKSRLPRLTLASRIACFVSIWLLTYDVGERQNVKTRSHNFLWMLLVAACSSLFPSMLLLRWSSTQFASDLAVAFSKLNQALSACVSQTSSEDVPTIHADLLRISMALNSVYQQASFELRIGRVSVKSLKPLIGLVEHLRRALSMKMLLPAAVYDAEKNETKETFYKTATELTNAILKAMKTVEATILGCFDKGLSPPLRTEKADLLATHGRLTNCIVAARHELRKICDDSDAQPPSQKPVNLPVDILELCSCMISLLQIAHEMQHALNITGDIIDTYNQSALRLWYPHFSLAWLGVAPSTILVDEDGSFLDEEISDVGTTSLSTQEVIQGIAEHASPTAAKRPKLVGKLMSAAWWRSLVYILWNHPRVLTFRLALSRAFRAINHSPHLRHAFKNAAGVTILAIPAFLSPGSQGRKWFTTCYGQWMLISYVWVLETNTGATWRVAYLRLSGTITGAIYAYVASVICRSNPYGLVVLVAFAELPISWVIIKTSFFSLGTVASITLPPILFTAYFNSNADSTWEIALLRMALISAGIVAALLTNSIFFPRHCRVMFLNSACRTLGLASQLYISMSRDLFHHHQIPPIIYKRETYILERSIRKSLHRMSLLLRTMDDELSLVPKPMRRYRHLHDILRQLSDLLTSLRKVREHIPRKYTVTAVARQRREMVSSICVSLFAAEQVFRARRPLPQFLPSCRTAVSSLGNVIHAQIQSSIDKGGEPLGMALVYAFAEMNALTELVETIDELLDVTRQLFGTSSWLGQTLLETTWTMSIQDELPSAV